MTDALNGIGVFVASVEAGGFSAAASRLNMSRSAVGKTVARLEARLGVRLFHRTTRAQSLTEDGQVFYERCQRALAELRAGEAMVDSGRKEAVGRLRVSMPVLFGRRCAAPILTRLAQAHPKLALELSFNDRPIDLIEDGFDLAIRSGTIGDGAGLMARRVATQHMTVCAAPAYLAAHGTPRTVEALGGHHAVAYARAGRVNAWLFPRPKADPVAVTPPSRLHFDDIAAVADAAAAGYGIAWLPCWLIRDRLRAGDLVNVLAEIPQLAFAIHAVWPQTPHLPLRVRLAIQALAEGLPSATAL